jgi:predicted unusual protein kinase regulating ubiquinone biosynthesis (AarF/ABC1/UbiB family)
MSTIERLHEAYEMTASQPLPDERREWIGLYLSNLEVVGSDIEPPAKPDAGEDLAFALLNRAAPWELRRLHANRAINSVKASLFAGLPTVRGVDMSVVSERAEALSAEFVGNVVTAAADYSKKFDFSAAQKSFQELLDPETKTPEDSTVAAVALFNIVQPYLVDRMLELDIYRPARMREQLAELGRDTTLLFRLSRSVSDLKKFVIEGETSVPDAEIADKLFDIGPIFVQMAQSFGTSPEDADDESRQFMARIGKLMQEGVAMPDAEQQQRLATGLPEGLELQTVFSSAKIAYIAETSAGDQRFATKILRPDARQALDDNVRVFQVMGDMVASYVDTHAAGTPLAEQAALVRQAFPFVLRAMRDEMLEEMDFINEARLQKAGAALLAGTDTLQVAAINDAYSDGEHITMELLPGQDIRDVPAHPGYLKGALALFLKGTRERFMHGDMHGRNVKAATDAPEGTLAVYDWGKSIEDMPRGFERDVVRFVASFVRAKPRAIARAHRRIQHPRYHQATQEEAEATARDAIDVAHQLVAVAESGNKLGLIERRKLFSKAVFSTFVFKMIIDHQSMMDTRYASYMRSTRSLAKDVIATELLKPAYPTRRAKAAVLIKSFLSAARMVYLPGSQKANADI